MKPFKIMAKLVDERKAGIRSLKAMIKAAKEQLLVNPGTEAEKKKKQEDISYLEAALQFARDNKHSSEFFKIHSPFEWMQMSADDKNKAINRI